MLLSIDEISANFELIGDPEEQLHYLMELGRALPELPAALRTEANRVRGCESQVWLSSEVRGAKGEERLFLRGQSDSMIVRGFVALMIALYDGKSLRNALDIDGLDLLKQLGFAAHVTSKRSNGVRAMVERIRRDANTAQAA